MAGVVTTITVVILPDPEGGQATCGFGNQIPLGRQDSDA